VTDAQLNQAISDIKDFIADLVSAIDLFYEGINEISSDIHYHIQVAIEDLLFPHIYKDLFELFKTKVLNILPSINGITL
jgi:hypothetical protein